MADHIGRLDAVSMMQEIAFHLRLSVREETGHRAELARGHADWLKRYAGQILESVRPGAAAMPPYLPPNQHPEWARENG